MKGKEVKQKLLAKEEAKKKEKPIQDSELFHARKNGFNLKTSEMKNEFTSHKIYANTAYIPYNKLSLMESEIISSLTFQKLLFFNIWFSLLYGYLTIYILVYKVNLTKRHHFEIKNERENEFHRCLLWNVDEFLPIDGK